MAPPRRHKQQFGRRGSSQAWEIPRLGVGRGRENGDRSEGILDRDINTSIQKAQTGTPHWAWLATCIGPTRLYSGHHARNRCFLKGRARGPLNENLKM